MLKLFKKKQEPKSIFMGRKVRRYWKLDESERFNSVYLKEHIETLERVTVLEKVMNFEFKIDDEVYLDEIGKYAKIEKKTKDTNGNIIYNITYVVEYVDDYDENLKIEYEKLKKIYDDKREAEEIENKRIEQERKLKEQKERKDYEDFCEAKKLINKKGVIIQKVPMNENRAVFSKSECQKIHEKINQRFMDYDVVTVPTDIEIFNYDNNGKIIGINNENIIMKN